MVIGGGVAGLEAAGQLAGSGFEVTLIEKENKTGGHLNDWYKLFPDRRDSSEVKTYLDNLISETGVNVLTDTIISRLERNGNGFDIYTTTGGRYQSDAIILSTGFDLFRSERKEEYGYGIYDNVISSADLEMMFRSGRIQTHSGSIPSRIGLVHCVGSRDEKVGNLYCSKLCCVTAVKQAIELRQHLPEVQVFCFYMDMRMGGAHYEELYREAQEDWSVNFIRGKVSEAGENIEGRVIVKVEDTLAGRPLKMELDLLVLMAGMEVSSSGKEIADSSGIKRGENRFFETTDHHFGSNRSSIEGLFFAGSCTAPMNITETISHARAAAMEAANWLKEKK